VLTSICDDNLQPPIWPRPGTLRLSTWILCGGCPGFVRSRNVSMIVALCDSRLGILTESCWLIAIRADGLSSSGKAPSPMRLAILLPSAAPCHSISRQRSSGGRGRLWRRPESVARGLLVVYVGPACGLRYNGCIRLSACLNPVDSQLSSEF
jgi:hypothetical protein